MFAFAGILTVALSVTSIEPELPGVILIPSSVPDGVAVASRSTYPEDVATYSATLSMSKSTAGIVNSPASGVNRMDPFAGMGTVVVKFIVWFDDSPGAESDSRSLYVKIVAALAVRTKRDKKTKLVSIQNMRIYVKNPCARMVILLYCILSDLFMGFTLFTQPYFFQKVGLGSKSI
jgi:hypothetical protein